MTVRDVVRGTVERLLSIAPRRTSPGDRLILAYHNVVPAGSPACGDRSLHLPVDRFEAQLQCLRAEADVVPLEALLHAGSARARLVAITFDDAYASALALGVAACVSRNMPCTVFVAPALLGRVPTWDTMAQQGQWSESDRHRFLWEQRGLGAPAPAGATANDAGATTERLRIATEAELLAACGQRGVTVGNHTMHHANLGALSTAEAAAELTEAGEWLRVRFPAAAPVVAYPYGIAPRDRAAAVPPAGLTHGLEVSGGWWRAAQAVAPLAVPRWNVPAGLSVPGFVVRVRGWFAGV